MDANRSKYVKWNILSRLFSRTVTLLCGLITPRLLIGAFGSEAYGLATSISQLLSYVALLEGGVGSVARAKLYEPLARGDQQTVSNIRRELRVFMLTVSGIFALYSLALAGLYPSLEAAENFDFFFVFSLVLAMAAALFAEYSLSLSDVALLHSAQRSYVPDTAYGVATILNTLTVVVMVRLGFGLVAIKVAAVLVFLLRPLVQSLYVAKVFQLPRAQRQGQKQLTQKWVGLGHNIAQFLQNNTDVALLTFFGELKLVSVYSIYYMVVHAVQNIASSVTGGMEALLGDMLARKEHQELNKCFDNYETAISLVSVLVFAVTAVLLAPFVMLYTKGVQDANYHQPMLALLLAVGAVLTCLRQCYHSLVYAAGHFRQTNAAAYGEAALNVGISLVLIRPMGLEGIALGTIIAIGFRFVYYVIYCSKRIICRPVGRFLKRLGVDALVFCLILLGGDLLLKIFPISSYLRWVAAGFVMVAFGAAVELIFNLIFFRRQTLAFGALLGRRFLRRRKE